MTPPDPCQVARMPETPPDRIALRLLRLIDAAVAHLRRMSRT